MPARLPASAASCGTHPLPPCCRRRPLQIAALVPEDVRAAFIPLYKCCYDRCMQLKSDEEQGVAAPACADGKGKEQVGCSWVAAVSGRAAAGTVAEHCQLEHIDGQQGRGHAGRRLALALVLIHPITVRLPRTNRSITTSTSPPSRCRGCSSPSEPTRPH